MKIGVLTFHRSINNGAVMQCYSLTKRLQREFPEDTVEVIDFHMPKIEKFYTPSLRNYFSNGSLILNFKKAIRLLQDPGYFRWQKKRKAAFDRALSVLPLSKETIFQDNSDELFRYINENYDVVIAGSDAIWNYVQRGYPNPYFLDSSVTCYKLSYAASCYGMSYEKISEQERNGIKKILDSYHILGTRDGEAEKFVSFVESRAPVIHTCDPTVFLDVNDLPIDEDQLIETMKSKGFDFSKQTIGVMGSNEMCHMVRKMYGKSIQIASLYNYNKDADVNLYDLSPYEWAYCFRYFEATVTTYFHGTHLSLRNGTPVVCVALETEYAKNHKTKVLDFLERLGLESWYFHSNYATIGVDEIKKQLDYFLVNDLKDDIIQRMDSEAKTFETFGDELRKIKSEICEKREIKND